MEFVVRVGLELMLVLSKTLFAPIRIISAVFIERSYLFSLVLAFYTLASGKGCFKVLFHTMFVNVYHHFLWCGCLAHVVRMVNTTCAEG